MRPAPARSQVAPLIDGTKHKGGIQGPLVVDGDDGAAIEAPGRLLAAADLHAGLALGNARSQW